MTSITHTLSHYKPITKDGLILKKLVTEGFGACPGKGMEVTVHYYSESEDGRFLDNTNVLREPYVFIIGKINVIPGLEIAIKSMQMGEKSVFCISPEYSFFAEEKFKKCEESLLMNLKDESFKTEVNNPYTPEQLLAMDVKDAKKYQRIYYEIELVKFDKPRPKKSLLSGDERYEQSAELKKEGNDLFMQKRYREAIVKYKDAQNYLTQMPTQFLTDKVRDMQNILTLNTTNCHEKLLEYNYALKNLEENFYFEKTPKAFYHKAICYMHLGEYELAEQNLKLLEKVLPPNDESVKKIYADYYALKNKNISKQKENYKRGLFEGGLYEEKKGKKEQLLPEKGSEKNNLKFYIDYIVNGDEMYPNKIKFEVFNHVKNNINSIYTQIENMITGSHKLINKEIQFDFTNEGNKTILVDSIKVLESDEVEKFNKYPPNEETLLILRNGNLEITCGKMENDCSQIINGVIVLGRCFYNSSKLTKLVTEKSKGVIKITDIDLCPSF